MVRKRPAACVKQEPVSPMATKRSKVEKPEKAETHKKAETPKKAEEPEKAKNTETKEKPEMAADVESPPVEPAEVKK